MYEDTTLHYFYEYGLINLITINIGLQLIPLFIRKERLLTQQMCSFTVQMNCVSIYYFISL